MGDNGDQRTEIEIHELSLIDVSSEDDSLLFSSFLDLSRNQFCEPDKDDKLHCFMEEAHDCDEDRPVSTLEEKDSVLKPHESPEPEKMMRSGKYNLRKSLAWDNAFFTSAGVLEPEELSSMMDSNHKSGKKTLATIEEDLQKSTESISTFQSDCTVENSQSFTLFDDVRASIQKFHVSAKLYDAATPGKSKEMGSPKPGTSPSSSMVNDSASLEKMKPKACPKKMSIRGKVSGSATKQPVTANGLNKFVSKSPNVLCKVRPMPTTSIKRTSLDIRKAKRENNSKLATGKEPIGPRISISASTRPVLARPIVYSTSSLRSSVTSKNELTSSCSSLESCASASSSASHKSSINSVRKNSSSSSSISSLANKRIPRNVPLARIPPISTKGASKTKLPSNVSSELSRASTLNKMVKASQKTIYGGKGSANEDKPRALKPLNNTKDGCIARHDSKADEAPNRPSAVNGGVAHLGSNLPTGLRVPLPKIGFFDGVKGAARTPTGIIQPRSNAMNHLPRHGKNSSSGSAAKSKPESLRLSKSPSQEPSNSKAKVNSSSVSRSPSVVPLKVQTKVYLKINAEEELKDADGKSIGKKSSPLLARDEGSCGGKQYTSMAADETLETGCPNRDSKSFTDQNSASGNKNMIISCTRSPKLGEMSYESVYKDSEAKTIGAEQLYIKRTPLSVNNSARHEDEILSSFPSKVVEVVDKLTTASLENIPDIR